MARTLPMCLSLAVVGLLVGCQLPGAIGSKVPVGVGASSKPRSPKAPSGIDLMVPGGQDASLRNNGTLPGTSRPFPGAGVVSSDGAGVISSDGAGVISSDGASIIGIAKLPAGVISSDGAGVISSDGAGVISSDGAGYRLAALSDTVPIRKQLVYLLNAESKLVTGRDGVPITAQTDESGRFEFKGFTNTKNLLVAIKLYDDKGLVTALLPRGDAPSRTVDLNLASTLTTTYIQEQYVKKQTDPVATLERLPAEVETETRKKAAEAVGKLASLQVTSLTAADVIGTVEKLRAADSVFNEQLEDVKKLLIAAGQSDLGNGQVATEVSLGAVLNLVPVADGALLLNCPYQYRIWKLAPNGRLQTMAGNGTPSKDSLDGKLAVEAGLGEILGVTQDASGRLVLLDRAEPQSDWGPRRVTRLGLDGRLTEFSLPPGFGLAAVPADSDEVSYFVQRSTDHVVEHWSLAPGRAPRLVHTFATAEGQNLLGTQTCGQDSQGRIYFARGYGAAVFRYDPADRTLQSLFDAQTDPGLRHLDSQGNLWRVDRATKALRLTMPDGVTRAWTVPDVGPLELCRAAALGANGQVYMGRSSYYTANHVYRVQEGQIDIVAGASSGSIGSGEAGSLALAQPGGLVATASGNLIVADQAQYRLLKVTPDRKVSLYAGTGTQSSGSIQDTRGDGGPALEATFSSPDDLCLDRAGNLFVLDGNGGHARIRKIAPDGTVEQRFAASGEQVLEAMTIGPDNSLYVLSTHLGPTGANSDDAPRILKLQPDGTTSVLFDLPAQYPVMAIGVDAAGRLYVTTQRGETGRLERYEAGKGWETLKEDPRFLTGGLGNLRSPMAFDAQGRLYFAERQQDTLFRFDPSTGAFKTLAGVGGTHFNGAGVDGSLQDPRFPVFTGNGDLYFSDTGHNQVKRIPASEL